MKRKSLSAEVFGGNTPRDLGLHSRWQLAGSVKLLQLWVACRCGMLLMVSCDWRFEGLECGQGNWMGLYGHYEDAMLSPWMTGSQMIAITFCSSRHSGRNVLHLLCFPGGLLCLCWMWQIEFGSQYHSLVVTLLCIE